MAKYTGLHTHRFDNNSDEKTAAKFWNEFNYRPIGGDDNLDWLLGNGSKPALDVSDRDRLVAATLMQWLGSPVGRSYLQQLQDRWNLNRKPSR